jgi:hypothetical protein
MQSVSSPIQPDLNSTTMRNYSLVADARENRDAAMAAWTAAYNNWKAEPTNPNLNALAAACEVHRKAQELYTSLSATAKHNRGTVAGQHA